MRHAKGVPQDDVRVVDGGGAVADPLGDAGAGLSGGLGDVAACGPQLVIAVCERRELVR